MSASTFQMQMIILGMKGKRKIPDITFVNRCLLYLSNDIRLVQQQTNDFARREREGKDEETHRLDSLEPV